MPTLSSSSTRRRSSTEWRRRFSAMAQCRLEGPKRGSTQRARRAEIQHYYDALLRDRFVGSGRVTFLGGSEYHTDGDEPSGHLACVGRNGARRGRGTESSTPPISLRPSRRLRPLPSGWPTARVWCRSTSSEV